MSEWLLKRLMEKDQPNPIFAFQGTVNWMRALSVLVDNESFSDDSLFKGYQNVKRRSINNKADTAVFENMLMAFHNHASLVTMNRDIVHPYDISRVAIVAWYYSIYFTCSAMIAATDGSSQESHSDTAKNWNTNLIEKGHIIKPFSLSLSNLLTKTVEEEVSEYKQGNHYDLNCYSETTEQAWGAIVSYLKGTADYERWKAERRIRKNDNKFNALKVENFRTKEARYLRDEVLTKGRVNFLVQAFRYRGKAHYRDSIFMTYGEDHSEKIKVLCEDLIKVSHAFQRMAVFYMSRRVKKGTWHSFVDDLERNNKLSINIDVLRI